MLEEWFFRNGRLLTEIFDHLAFKEEESKRL